VKAKQHIIFWIVVSIILIFFFGKSLQSYSIAFYFVAFLLPVIIITSYFFNYVLVPKYLLRKLYGLFILYMVYTLIISLYLEMIVITLSFIVLANYRYAELTPIFYDIFLLGILLYFVVFLNSFILLIIRSQKDQLKQKELIDQKEKLEVGCLVVRSNRKSVKISYDEIGYLESLGDYVKIISQSNQPILTKEKISHLEVKLPEKFLRVHRSFIVNTDKILSFNKEEVVMNNISIPISRTYKKAALEFLNG